MSLNDKPDATLLSIYTLYNYNRSYSDLMKSIFLLFSAALSQTVTIQGRLQPTPYEAPQFKGLEVYLDNGLAGFVQENGQFAVHHVPVGTTFILKVKSPRLTYPSLRIDVNAAGKFQLLTF